MTNKLVTIILPVYNGEKYLKRAIDSVLNQTIGYDKLTLLVINDGGRIVHLKLSATIKKISRIDSFHRS